MNEPKFGKNFIFGAATSAYQIEGSPAADGKGLSVWDVFCHTQDTVYNHDDGDRACDSYLRWREDVELLAELGADAYRFSVSWPRVLPEGAGKPNPKGLDYYKKLCDALLEKGVRPCVTLYHWDMPYALSLKGGLMNRDFAGWFADYAAVVARELGDRVSLYFTFNEPESIVGAGYCYGAFAPGCKFGDRGSFPAVHNLLLAHGDAARLLKDMGKEVGAVCSGPAPYPADEKDGELVRLVEKQLASPEFVWSTPNIFDPIFLGDYSAEFYAKYRKEAERTIKQGDLARIAGNTDYCCINHYSGYPVIRKGEGLEKLRRPSGSPLMANGWDVDEKGIYWTLKFLYGRYKKPLMLTENGMDCHDIPSSDGVHDAARIDYFRRFLTQLNRAAADGADIRAYFAWSLLDNFEWLAGYSSRFGLVYVDGRTCNRIPKDSFYYLQRIFSDRNK